MRAIPDKVGDVDILIEAIEDVNVINGGRKTQETSVEELLKNAYDKAKTVIWAIAQDVGDQIKPIHAAARPKELEIEFSLGLSSQSGVWVLTAKGEAVFRVKMTWDTAKDASSI